MFLLPYHVTFIIIYVTKTAFYHYRLQEKAIKKVLKKCNFLCQEIKYKMFLLFYMYPLLFLLKNLLSVPGNQV